MRTVARRRNGSPNRDLTRPPAVQRTVIDRAHPSPSARPQRFGHNFSRIPVSTPGDVHERQADHLSERLTAGSGPELELPHGGGGALPPSLRDYFEPRLGHSLEGVRIHTGAQAAASAHALKARAYTAGRDVVFGAGEFAPHTSSGRRLLAHELVHVAQQGTAPRQRIDRAPAETSGADDGGADLDGLLAQITQRTTQNTATREKLDALAPQSSAEREQLTKQLDAGRKALIPLLQQRIALLTKELSSLGSSIGTFASTPGDPGKDVLGEKLNRYEKELRQHQLQLGQLTRWQTRQRIGEIDAQVAQLDSQIAKLPQVSDPNDPAASLLASQRDALVAERKSATTSLTSSAHEYKQHDKRWGSIRYGGEKWCTKIKEAGCGPAALAMVLNFLFAEDPEAVTSASLEFVTPDTTAAYAEHHGRVCNDGTNGPSMVTNVATQWPGYRGKSLTFAQVAGELRNGNLVIFLCHSCSGQTRRNTVRSYGGHFMVLNGVDAAGKSYDVLDSGDNESNDIETITADNLKKHSVGFWTVEKK